MVIVGCAGGNHNARWISVDFKSAVAGLRVDAVFAESL